MLEIKNVSVSAGEKKILKNVSLRVENGKKVVLMGPNGSGKSTLCKAIMGDPAYKIEGGSVLLDGVDITRLRTDEKALLGLFMIFQEPEGIDGLNAMRFLRSAYSKRTKNMDDFQSKLSAISEKINMNKELLSKELNVTLSGGEKKKLEMLQMLLLDPKYALVDEFDSGLDIDSVKLISNSINSAPSGFLIVTHNPAVLKRLKVDEINVIKDGEIIASGGANMVEKIEREGFLWTEKKL